MDYQQILRTLSVPGGTAGVAHWAGGLLAHLAGGGSPLQGVRHPLGFVCLPVERDGEYGVCLHIWSAEEPGGRPDTGAIHCHSWDLVSLVLYGSVTNERIDVIDDDAAPTHRIFQVSSRDGRDEFSSTSRTVRYDTAARETARTGEVYRLPAGVFHKTVVPDGEAAVTVALGRERVPGVNLSLGTLEGAVAPSVRRILPQERTVDLARRWAAVISNGSAARA